MQKKHISFKEIYKSKDGKRYICTRCKQKVGQKQTLYANEKRIDSGYEFPVQLKRELMKSTNYLAILKKYNLEPNDERNIEKALRLNKLESYLLKLVIPFIRIGHCPRGRYLKLRGNLILISADVSHSLIRILPAQQNLIPVAFKRKICYTGSFIEEVIDKSKVKTYFNYFKKVNPLFKDVKFNIQDVEIFEQTIRKQTSEVEKQIEKEDSASNELSSSDGDSSTDFVNSQFNATLHSQEVEDEIFDEKFLFKDQTTVLANKYESDVKGVTVANKLANVIVQIDSSNMIDIERLEEQLDVNDEINLEEIDDFLDFIDNRTDDDVEIEESENDIKYTSEIRKDDIYVNQSETIETIKKKVQSICVAPGEKGTFQNWGEDAFLEEKAFPELFPLGVGGYISTKLEEDDNCSMGFAMYVKHRLLSANPKFRENTSYILFLLLVKELVQLNQCKQTYLRQATKLPNLTKESILHSHKHDIARFNRSYDVFKNIRGTVMYYESSKKNVMALLRQKGAPTLFLTMSCAEYAWKDLLKEVVEYVERRQVTEAYLESLTIQQKNKMISENVVLTTLHFQKRIEKELKLMTHAKFFNNKCDLSVKSYYYRVEFQQRGAPHIHCLLWLEDKDGNEAPTFWTSSDNNEDIEIKEKNVKMKIKNIEDVADKLIFASEMKAMCEHHLEQTQSGEIETSKECDSCYSPTNDFKKCQVHHIKELDVSSCEECATIKNLVKSCQTHRHTFTCQKKKKSLNIMETEGHGRFDNIQFGDALLNSAVCRFNYPQFPLNRTTFVFGFPKDLSTEEKSKRRTDLKKIKKYLIRQTFKRETEECQSYEKFIKLSFIQFLHEVGMFERESQSCTYTDEEKKNAYDRYINALSASVRGTGCIFLERNTKDVFTNNFNLSLLVLHKANIDVQIVIDQVIRNLMTLS